MAGQGERSRAPSDVADEAFVYLYSRLPFLIQRTSQILTAMFSAQPGALDVTLPQFHLLDLLGRGGASPQIDLARQAGIDAATAGLIVANLVRSGRVQRRVDSKDSRRKIVAITNKGHRVLAAAAESHRAVDRMIAERLTPDASSLGGLLDRLSGDVSTDAVRSLRANEPDETHVALELALKLRRCLQVSERHMAAAVGPLGLTMRQFAALYIMPVMPGLMQADIVRLLGYETSNAALVLRILNQKRLVEALERDTRRRRYRITSIGKKLLMTSHPLVIAAEESLTKDFDDMERCRLQRLLGKVIQVFDADMRHPIPTFVSVQSQPGWPMAATPAPSFLDASVATQSAPRSRRQPRAAARA